MMSRVSFQQIGRNFYNPEKVITKSEGIQIWPGCFSSINRLEGGMLVKLELSYKTIRTETLFEYLCANKGKSHELLNEDLKFKSIVTLYGTNSKTQIIERIEFSKSIEDGFERKDKSKISFKDYFKEQYGVVLK